MAANIAWRPKPRYAPAPSLHALITAELFPFA
jgi:hypothetical protein